MMVLLNDTMVNMDNVCSMKRYYRITKTPGLPEMKDQPRLSVLYVGGKVDHIYYKEDAAELMDQQFLNLTEQFNGKVLKG